MKWREQKLKSVLLSWTISHDFHFYWDRAEAQLQDPKTIKNLSFLN